MFHDERANHDKKDADIIIRRIQRMERTADIRQVQKAANERIDNPVNITLLENQEQEDIDIIIRRIGRMRTRSHLIRIRDMAIYRRRQIGDLPTLPSPPQQPSTPSRSTRQRPDYPVHRGLFKSNVALTLIPVFMVTCLCLTCGRSAYSLLGFMMAAPDTQTAMTGTLLARLSLAGLSMLILFVLLFSLSGRFFNKATDERIEREAEVYRRGFRE